uniref:Endonuclease V n=1 Tax=Oryctolagus cuniculus TaxID=9986 RepID=G1U2V2_RABIT
MARRVASGPEACVCGRTGPRVHATKVPGPRRHDNEEGGAYAGAAEVTFPEGRPRPSHGPEGGGAAPGRNPAALETARLRARVVDRDTEAWQRDPGFSGLRRVGGADVSFVKGDSASACASLVVLSFPELQVVYEESRMVRLTAPYVSGFLAFREAPFLVDAVQRLREKQPDLMPQVLLVDGNGVLHHQGFGVACHLGVLTDLPCIGVAKKLLQVDGLEKDAAHKEQALRSHDRSTKPVYVSVGHKVSLETAVRLTRHCCRFRVPEPVRQVRVSWGRGLSRHLRLATRPSPTPHHPGGWGAVGTEGSGWRT